MIRINSYELDVPIIGGFEKTNDTWVNKKYIVLIDIMPNPIYRNQDLFIIRMCDSSSVVTDKKSINKILGRK